MYCMSERRASERTDTLRACVRTYLNVRYGNCLHTYIWSPFAIVACGVRTYLNVRYGNCLHTYPHTCILRTMRYRSMGRLLHSSCLHTLYIPACVCKMFGTGFFAYAHPIFYLRYSSVIGLGLQTSNTYVQLHVILTYTWHQKYERVSFAVRL